MKKSLSLALILLGVTAISSQIILVREFLTVFYGNELSVGLILSAWLLAGALGAFFASAIGKKTDIQNTAFFSGAQIALSILIPISIFLTQTVRIFFNINLGELASIVTMLAWSFVCLIPICALLGFMFVTGCRLYREKSGKPDRHIAGTYLLESIGATLGGTFTALILIRILGNLEIAFFISFLNLLSAYFLVRSCIGSFYVRKRVLLSLIALFIIFVFMGGVRFIDAESLKLKWKGVTLLKSEDSIYGNVALVKMAEGYAFFSNGIYTVGAPDALTAEETVHFPMLMHPDPRHILLVGGGEGEVIYEILKYPGTNVTYVELDPLPIEFAGEFLQKKPWYELDNPRVSINIEDARLFIKQTTKRFDVIIINLPDPYTAQINRFYTREFFGELKKVLNPKGIVAFSVVSSENYISRELGEFLRSILRTLKCDFADVKVIPGDTAHFIASNEIGLITLDYKKLEVARIKKDVDTEFIRPYYLFAKLSQTRIDQINTVLSPEQTKEGDVLINTDFHPISYYFDMVLWTTYQSNRLALFFEKINKSVITVLFLVMSFLILGLMFLIRRFGFYRRIAALFALGTTGFSEMTFQIVIILGFQTIYGFLYYKIGIIFTAFMAGLALGTFIIMRSLDKVRHAYTSYIYIQLAVLVYPLLLMLLFFQMSKGSGIFYNLGSNIIFSCLPFIAGFVGGLQYPIANKIYLENDKNLGKSAGITYASDLLGACLGGLLVSAFVIPLIGIYRTCVGITLLNLVALAALLLGAKRKDD